MLYGSGDILVRGAGLLAKRYKLGSFFVGATIVAFGTSAPELFVSLISKIKGLDSISLGNILGSNIANGGFVLGFSLFLTTKAKNNGVAIPKLDLILSFLIPVIFAVSLFIGFFSKIVSLLMLLMFSYFIFIGFKNNKNDSKKENYKDPDADSLLKILLFIITGSLGLAFGANIFVKGASDFASSLGVSELLVGVTITAVGTSLPELVASIVSIIKNDTQMSIGNILGSNIMNFYFVLGLVGTIFTININANAILELVFISLLTISLFLISRLKTKKSGLIIGSIYFIYIIFVLFRA